MVSGRGARKGDRRDTASTRPIPPLRWRPVEASRHRKSCSDVRPLEGRGREIEMTNRNIDPK